MVELAADRPDRDTFEARLRKRFPRVTSPSTARGYTLVASSLGFLECGNGWVGATSTGAKFVDTGDGELVRDALFERIAGVWELCELLREEPRRIGLLLPAMQELGFGWQTDKQLRYRLRWLEEVGLVAGEGEARVVYSMTAPMPRRRAAARLVATAEAARGRSVLPSAPAHTLAGSHCRNDESCPSASDAGTEK